MKSFEFSCFPCWTYCSFKVIGFCVYLFNLEPSKCICHPGIHRMSHNSIYIYLFFWNNMVIRNKVKKGNWSQCDGMPMYYEGFSHWNTGCGSQCLLWILNKDDSFLNIWNVEHKCISEFQVGSVAVLIKYPAVFQKFNNVWQDWGEFLLFAAKYVTLWTPSKYTLKYVASK